MKRQEVMNSVRSPLGWVVGPHAYSENIHRGARLLHNFSGFCTRFPQSPPYMPVEGRA
jgi:hypothetical protein